MHKKGTSSGITNHDFNLYYKAIVMKTLGIGIKTDRWTNGIESKVLILIHTPINI